MSQIPPGEAKKAANGKWVCLVCSVFLDCPEVLLIHRNGSSFIAFCLQSGKKHKNRVEYLQQLQDQKAQKSASSSLKPRALKRKATSIEDKQEVAATNDQSQQEYYYGSGDFNADSEYGQETATYYNYYYYGYQPEADQTTQTQPTQTSTNERPQPTTIVPTTQPTEAQSTREKEQNAWITVSPELREIQPEQPPTKELSVSEQRKLYQQQYQQMVQTQKAQQPQTQLSVSEQRALFKQQFQQMQQTQYQQKPMQQQIVAAPLSRKEAAHERYKRDVQQQYKLDMERRKQDFLGRLATEGWLQNAQGQYYRSPDVEWDSDDELPIVPPGLSIQFMSDNKRKK